MAAPPPRRKTLAAVPGRADRLLVAAQDLRLYALQSAATTASVVQRKASLLLLATNNDYPQMKCVALSHDPATPDLVAIGTSSGRVFLTNLAAPTDPYGSEPDIKREFSLRTSRTCNVLGFNPVFHHQLFQGLEKGRSECALLVWDLNSHHQGAAAVAAPSVAPPPALAPGATNTASPQSLGLSVGSTSDGRRMSTHLRTPLSSSNAGGPTGDDEQDMSRTRHTSVVMDPVKQFGQNESVSSACWVLGSPYYLAASMSLKYIRLYDTRAADMSSIAYVNSKNVLGLQADPLREYRFASFSEDGFIRVWDARKLAGNGLVSFQPESRNVLEIAWSPHRPGLLGSISKDDPFVSLWDLHDQPVSVEDDAGNYVPVLLRSSQTGNVSDTIQSFVWHPMQPNSLITLNRTGVIENVKIHRAPQMSWTPSGQLMLGHHNQFTLFDATQLPGSADAPDVAQEMRTRALAGYALNMDTNVDIATRAGKRELAQLWLWMQRSQHAYRGLHELFCGPSPPDMSTLHTPQLLESDGQLPFDVYISEQRRLALLTCGWGPEDAGGQYLTTLEQQKQYERAALMSLFYLDLRRSIATLNLSGDEKLRLLALALAGYSNEGAKGGFNSLWRQAVTTMIDNLSNPYLAAMFGFLTDTSNFSSVLYNDGLYLCDRVAFACRFLNDDDLSMYIKEMTQQAIDHGNLEGILLTGLTPRGVDLTAAYVNRTADVQTTGILFAQTVPRKFKDERAEVWRETYRDLLDQWQLWHERAHFDIACKKLSPEFKPVPQAFVRCNFCNQLLSPATVIVASKSGAADANARRRVPAPASSGAAPNSKAKSTVCPNPSCRKPLPRCAICLLNLGSPISSTWSAGDMVPASAQPAPSLLSQWFSWCQTCRHGGHVDHLDEWFRDHATCPVADCSCRCRGLDRLL